MSCDSEGEGQRQRRRLTIAGVVQGVGFRPFLYGLATRLGLAGAVRNIEGGVRVEIEGPEAAVERFVAALGSQLPPLAVIAEVHAEIVPALGEAGFSILASHASGDALTPVSPDVAVCEACLGELLNPTDRRYRYPFINCTDCGPRFTLIEDVPYDRPQTTMRAFAMCARCQAEYDDPSDRRFHAQPNACWECGPRLEYLDGSAPAARSYGEAALAAAREALGAGRIVALKGIGGFHLACDATDEAAVARLRERKGRRQKPFALMARDLGVVGRYAAVSAAEARVLRSAARPIVLLTRLAAAAPLAAAVAPGQPALGFLLPYAPMHHLLLGDTPLVMTSGNLGEEPIARENGEALTRLAGLADAFLLHDRGIHAVCDDSVVRLFEGRELPLRRSRGYAPYPIRLPAEVPPVLAVGGELKATICVARGRQAVLSQHIGDVGNVETLAALERAVEHLGALERVAPACVVCDLHPGYLSARWALDYAKRAGVPLQRVQHHHAHVAAAMVEHAIDPGERVLGLSFDGTGFGTDGAIWGGELLLAGYGEFERLGHLKPFPLPGGDGAIRFPRRVALALLREAGIEWSADLAPVAATSESERRVLARQFESGFGVVPTTSMGRLFDGLAALCGVRQEVSYEAQAAMEFEGLVGEEAPERAYPFPLSEGAPWIADPAPLLRQAVADLRAGRSARSIAARFHLAVAELALEWCRRARHATGVGRVALTGGVFQNVTLLAWTADRLRRDGFEPLVHRQVPPNDGGLALGQAAIAGLGGVRGRDGIDAEARARQAPVVSPPLTP